MRVREFLAEVSAQLPDLLPPDLREFQSRSAFTLLQLYYWYPAVHYELWLQRKTGRIEVGLHFEGEREHNLQWLAALAERMGEVQAATGRPVEIEEWTAVWTRLHYTVDYGELDQGAAAACAGELAGLITGLQPLLEEIRQENGFRESPVTRSPRRMGGRTRGSGFSR